MSFNGVIRIRNYNFYELLKLPITIIANDTRYKKICIPLRILQCAIIFLFFLLLVTILLIPRCFLRLGENSLLMREKEIGAMFVESFPVSCWLPLSERRSIKPTPVHSGHPPHISLKHLRIRTHA